MDRYAIIVAGGSGTRMGTEVPKQFLDLESKPIVVQTIKKFVDLDGSIRIILVLPKEHLGDWDQIQDRYLKSISLTVVTGGDTRTESVKAGLNSIEGEGLVAIHDAVRPFVTEDIIQNSYESAARFGSGVASVKIKDSLRELTSQEDSVAKDRDDFVSVQTPQTFSISAIKKAYKIVGDQSFSDDATAYEKAGFDVRLIQGSYANIKITTPEDLK